MGKVDRLKFRELNAILWDMHHRFIEPEVAFQMYEKRWGFIDEIRMEPEEKRLLERLVKDFGGGHFMPSS